LRQAATEARAMQVELVVQDVEKRRIKARTHPVGESVHLDPEAIRHANPPVKVHHGAPCTAANHFWDRLPHAPEAATPERYSRPCQVPIVANRLFTRDGAGTMRHRPRLDDWRSADATGNDRTRPDGGEH